MSKTRAVEIIGCPSCPCQ